MSYFLKNFHKVVSYTYVLFYNLLFSLHIFWAVSILLGHYICLSVLVVGCEVAQSCPTLCNPMGCSLPGSSIHGIFQARVVEGIAISFFRGSSWPRDRTWVFHIVGRRFIIWTTRYYNVSIQPSHMKFNYLQTFTISSIAAVKIYARGSLCSCGKTSVRSY